MKFNQRINAFCKLGLFLKNINSVLPNEISFLEKNKEILIITIQEQHIYNSFFTETFVYKAIESIANMLDKDLIVQWLEKYPTLQSDSLNSKKVAVIMAGNIPLVGFHDFLCVLISGHSIICKQSSNDNKLLPIIVDVLIKIDNDFESLISFSDNKIEGFDAVIATGSNNSAKIFESYFSKYPHIIRKNRSSVAILSGNETNEDFKNLSNDIFLYFCLGCRNVSKLLVPKDYNFNQFFENMQAWEHIAMHNKYQNNHDYNRSIYLINQTIHLDNGFLILKEDKSLHSPIAVLYIEYYNDLAGISKYIQLHKEEIQCVVSNLEIENTIKFGQAQNPSVWDYADGVDTIEFLINITD